jgi:GNAT superfamily N-acetyltransferase
MKILLSRATMDGQPQLLGQLMRYIADDISFLRASYPRFDDWFARKVIPGISLGERTVVIERRGAAIAGLMILKHTVAEKKLCTLRVRPDFESLGLGIRLFEDAFSVLETEQPLLSVSEHSMPKFVRLFAHFGFEQEAVYSGRYLPAVEEIAYNGLLDPPVCTPFNPYFDLASSYGDRGRFSYSR